MAPPGAFLLPQKDNNMGSKYTSQTVSGFNSAPPSDDGSTASTNKVFWSTIKTKLADPLNTAIAAINSALVTATDFSMRSVTSTDSTVAGDHMRTLQVPSTVTTTFTISLADAATMTNGYIVRVRNSSQVGITIGRATSGDTLDGAATNKLLPPGATGVYAVNAAATGYVTLSYAGPVQDTDAIVAGGTDGTKKVRLEVDGLATGTTRVLTVQDSDDTLVGRATTDTLTNKTLTSPTINTAAAGGTWTAASTWTLPAFTLGGAVTLPNSGTINASGDYCAGGTSTDPSGGNAVGAVLNHVGYISATRDGGACTAFNRKTDDGTITIFAREGVQKGSVSIAGSTTSFNTSCDRRLKPWDVTIDDSGAVIDALRPVYHNWTDNLDAKVPGFIAQEAFEVVPLSVTPGDLDPNKKHGDEGFEPWSMDASKLVPFLVAEIKSLRARLATAGL
jgi:hypothetical protein